MSDRSWLVHATAGLNVVLWLAVFGTMMVGNEDDISRLRWIAGGGLAFAAIVQHQLYTRSRGA